MSVANMYVYPQSVVWNALTWDKTNGGPKRIDWDRGGREIEEGTGDAQWNTFGIVVEPRLRVRVHLTDLKIIIPINTKSNMVANVLGKGSAQPINWANMVYKGLASEQPYANLGLTTHEFIHESADGTTDPMT